MQTRGLGSMSSVPQADVSSVTGERVAKYRAYTESPVF